MITFFVFNAIIIAKVQFFGAWLPGLPQIKINGTNYFPKYFIQLLMGIFNNFQHFIFFYFVREEIRKINF